MRTALGGLNLFPAEQKRKRKKFTWLSSMRLCEKKTAKHKELNSLSLHFYLSSPPLHFFLARSQSVIIFSLKMRVSSKELFSTLKS